MAAGIAHAVALGEMVVVWAHRRCVRTIGVGRTKLMTGGEAVHGPLLLCAIPATALRTNVVAMSGRLAVMHIARFRHKRIFALLPVGLV